MLFEKNLYIGDCGITGRFAAIIAKPLIGLNSSR